MELIILSVICLIGIPISGSSTEEDTTPDNTKFGYLQGAPLDHSFDIVTGFPKAAEFFPHYALQSKPLVMRGAAKSAPAFDLWKSDEYFLNLDLPDDEFFTVETMKKENRTQEILDLNFRDFLETYIKEDRYMVHHVPEFIGRDVPIPDPIECEDIVYNGIVDAIMWFSSGGTKSVVHTDFVDNLNCVFAGSKHFVMVHPRYAEQVLFDHPEGAYADIDVDNVDYEKYQGLLSARYQHVDIEEGDCLFIPYKWIHQVRSYGGRNIAINIWWDTHRNKDIDFTKCNMARNQPLTLNDVDYIGFDAVLDSAEAVRDQFLDYTRHLDMSLEKYLKMATGNRELERMGAGLGYQIPVKQMYKIIDQDGDDILTHKEVKQVLKESWMDVREQIARFDAIMEALDRRWEEERQGADHSHHRDEL